MSTSESSTTYFIRVRGRILGPYNVAQLKALRARGQLSRANEVSTDRTNWQSVVEIEHLFNTGIKTFNTSIKTTSSDLEELEEVDLSTAPPPRSAPIWHYAVGDEQYGPVTLVELRGMLRSGQVMDDDLVWKDGMADWVPLSSIAELKAVSKPGVVTTGTQPSPIYVLQSHFCIACGSATDARAEVCPKCGVRQSYADDVPRKDRITAALLAFFLGGFGVHHFYLGNTLIGVIYVIFCWTLIPAIIAFVEFIILMTMSDKKFAAKYARAM
jgi:TM2 domain-containing membrane protein YozV